MVNDDIDGVLNVQVNLAKPPPLPPDGRRSLYLGVASPFTFLVAIGDVVWFVLVELSDADR